MRADQLADTTDWPVTLRLGADLRDRIDEWRRYQGDIPPRAEAARRLIEIALDVQDH